MPDGVILSTGFWNEFQNGGFEILDKPFRDHVGSVQRAMAVLEVLAAHPAGMSMSEVAERAGLTRAGARRLLLTLEAEGYASLDGRRFQLTPRLLTLVRTWLQGTTLWSYAEPAMRALAAQLQEACSAAVLSGQDIVYVARVPGRESSASRCTSAPGSGLVHLDGAGPDRRPARGPARRLPRAARSSR